MKKIYLLILLFVASLQTFAQTVFSENFGTPTGTTLIAAYATGTAPATFQSSAPIVVTGTADIRSTTASTTTHYPSASGGGNCFMTNSAGRFIQFDGINTSAYQTSNLSLSFGYLTSNITTQMVVEVSDNGGAWTALTFANNATASTTAYVLKTITSGIPSSTNLSLRFSQPGTTSQFRIDDIMISNFNANCPLAFGAATTTCTAITNGIDTYSATIPFTGGGAGYSVTASAGTVSGNDPATTSTGSIVVSGITEGTALTITVSKATCTAVTATIAAPECETVNGLPYTESFDYTVGSDLGVISQKWSNKNTGDSVLAVAGSLNYPGTVSAGNSVAFSGAGNDPFTPFTLTSANKLYTAFLITVSSLTSATVASPTTTYFASLTDGVSPSVFVIRYFLKNNGSQYFFGLDGLSTTSNYEATGHDLNMPNAIITEYDFATDIVKMWINPTAPDFVTSTPSLTATVAATSIGGFILRQDSTGATPSIIFDELRITTDPLQLSTNNYATIEGLRVYPNPVSNGTLFIKTSAGLEKEISIFDVLGKQVLNTKTTSESINIASLRSGLYFVKITENGITVTKKVAVN
jgi:hypothetical protein